MGLADPALAGSSAWPGRGPFFWPAAAAVFIFVLTFFSINKDVGSDPKLTLLVSQAILDHGTIRLDAYQQDQLIDFPFQDYVERTKMILERNDHFYPYFPAGPSVLSLPFVWLHGLLGKDMRTYDNFELQIFLAALTATLVFLLLYEMGSYLVGRRASLIISFIAVTGSSLISTLGTALWTINYSTLFISATLLLLVRDSVLPEGAAGRRFMPYVLGLLLFLCYFSRASTAVFIVPVLAYLFFQRRPLFWPAAGTALVLLLLFLGWSRLEYGTWLPDYYSLARFQQARPPIWVAVLGHLFSPSRGLFVYSPFFILLLAGAALYWRTIWRQPLFWMCLTWLALNLLVVSRAVIWWGGYSFGPRLLTDSLPGLVLLLFLFWREAAAHGSAAQQRSGIALFLLLGATAIAIHLTGLYRPATMRWNLYVIPTPTSISGPLGDLFAWRYAQFMAGNELLCELEAEKTEAYLLYDDTLAPYALGTEITPSADRAVPVLVNHTLQVQPLGAVLTATLVAAEISPLAAPASTFFLPAVSRPGNTALFIGWDNPTTLLSLRPSICPRAEIVVRLDDEPITQETIWLNLNASSAGVQPVNVAVNGTAAGSMTWDGPLSRQSISFPSFLLLPGALNTITLEFPQAQSSRPFRNYYRLHLDDRQLALQLHDLTLSPDPSASLNEQSTGKSQRSTANVR